MAGEQLKKKQREREKGKQLRSEGENIFACNFHSANRNKKYLLCDLKRIAAGPNEEVPSDPSALRNYSISVACTNNSHSLGYLFQSLTIYRKQIHDYEMRTSIPECDGPIGVFMWFNLMNEVVEKVFLFLASSPAPATTLATFFSTSFSHRYKFPRILFPRILLWLLTIFTFVCFISNRSHFFRAL